MTRAAPEPAAEVWTYGGVRVGKDGKRVHAWLDASGEALLFSRTGARMAVGSQYTVSVSRHDETITLHGTPAYAGSAADEATRRAAWAEHTVAQTRLEMIRAERNDARRSALDEALAPLLELAGPLRTSAERDALAAYIIRKLHTHGTRSDLRPAQRFSTPPARTVTDSPEEKSHAHTGLPGQRRVPRPPRGLPGLHARGTAQRLRRQA